MALPPGALDEIGVRFTGKPERVADWSLALASAGIEHRVEPILGGYQLLVELARLRAATSVLDDYDRENPPPAIRRTARDANADDATDADLGGSSLGLVLAIALLLFHLVVRLGLGTHGWLQAGAASAERVLHGEWWRAVTALTLHAGFAHVVGNAAACAIFVTLLGRRVGFGLGALLVLASGAGGNLLNALAHGSHHISVGASTAMLGAVGLLGGLAAMHRQRFALRQAWVPLAAALALLAMVGTAKDSDLFAHLFGFLVGVVLGGATGWALHGRLRAVLSRRATQWTLALASLAVVVASWALALAR